MNLPIEDELKRVPKLSSPDSASRSLPVKCSGLPPVPGSTEEEHCRLSPNKYLCAVGPSERALREWCAVFTRAVAHKNEGEPGFLLWRVLGILFVMQLGRVRPR
jgi:hypothetical protein